MRRLIRIRGGIAIVVAAIVLLSGCGGSTPHPISVEVAEFAYRPAWVESPDVTERVVRVVERAAEKWGGADLGHLTVRLVPFPSQCDGSAIGCATFDGSDEWTIEVAWWGPCPEATVLAHEVGHVAVPGDSSHTDPRWCDGSFWEEMATTLAVDVDARCADDTRVRVGGNFATPVCR